MRRRFGVVGARRRPRCLPLALGLPLGLLLCAALTASDVGAQVVSTVSPSDPVYTDLRRLEAFGLVPRGSGGAGPWSAARIAWMVRDAAALAVAHDLPEPRRGDVDAMLTRLGSRFAPDADAGPSGLVEVEVGGGRSPGRYTPDRGLGSRDAVFNPLWVGRNGRAYGDRTTWAVAARVAVPLGAQVGVTAGVRRWGGSSTGEPPGGGGATSVENLAVHARLGGLQLDVGRDHVWGGDGSSRELILSGNAPPLDLIRLGTDAPAYLSLLGDVDFTLFVADLGESQEPAHAKLFGLTATSRPTEGLELGLTLLNKQFGEGAPEGTLGERLRDLTWVGDWFTSGSSDFSNKLAQLSVRARSGGGASVFASMLLTDFDHRRLRHTFRGTAGYRAGAELATLGRGGRHALAVEATWLGPYVYVHHQFVSGHAADGFPMGSYLGPDSRSARLAWSYHPALRAWWGQAAVTVDDAHGDTWRSQDGDGPFRIVDGPDEVRLRGELQFHALLAGGRGGVDVMLGLERTRRFAFQPGDARLAGATLVRVWHAL